MHPTKWRRDEREDRNGHACPARSRNVLRLVLAAEPAFQPGLTRLRTSACSSTLVPFSSCTVLFLELFTLSLNIILLRDECVLTLGPLTLTVRSSPGRVKLLQCSQGRTALKRWSRGS